MTCSIFIIFSLHLSSLFLLLSVMSELGQFIGSIPPVTRTFVITAVVMAGLNALQVVSITEFCPEFSMILGKYQLHRLFTGFLVPNNQPMQGMMEIYMLYSFSKGIEEGKFKRNLPDYLYYHMIILPIMVICSYIGFPPLYSLNPALLSALTYTWSVLNYNQEVNFYFMPIKASLLPAVSLGFRLIVDGTEAFTLALVGSFAAYVYNCLETQSLGPLVQVFTGKEPQKGGARLGTAKSMTSNVWFYSTGILRAPAWLHNLVCKFTGVDYNSMAYNRSGFTVIPPKKHNVHTAAEHIPARAFKGQGRRLGSLDD